MDWFTSKESNKRTAYVRKKVIDFSNNERYLELKKKIICVKNMIDHLFFKKHNVDSENKKIAKLQEEADQLIEDYQHNVTPKNKDSSIDNPGWSNRNYMLDQEYEDKISELTTQVDSIEKVVSQKNEKMPIKSCNAAGGKRKTRRAKKNTRSRK
uniref:Uncharacterized protein n=1 Tax=viral metagenome TaxID=1070528 RepID=A0A6C0IGV6_9ZZZZ